ncbi:hypothetical protein LPJ38_18515 [Bradyrhizobium daqingense]|uniref:Uncharacterized protein n=1 Tax=Bradyrhizobium daqingense TaxID=993502 RepID=A0A562LTU5_9BRAD|nr:hypothetical protein [Bradyrhizobium daqingense]TWI11064.1 hypothetical protein IQ17_00213 [Bradyrhizobium daqingense]UFS92625.1 hypothetical protein LPJ38_18515 [Bradyrhizobium daqingense]
MRSATLLALSLLFAGLWPHDGARGQTSAAPPVSLAPPDASPPRASAKNSRPPPSGREAFPPVMGRLTPAPNPAADYDGFSAVDDNDTPSRVAPAARSRAAKGAASNTDADGQSSIDQEDESLKRKLTICKNCK